MYLRVDVVTAPSEPVVSVELVKQHARIDSTYDENLLAFYIESATELCQSYLNRSLVTRTLRMIWSDSHQAHTWRGYGFGYGQAIIAPIGWQYLFQGRGNSISLPYGSVQSITSVGYRGINDDVDTVLVNDIDYRSSLSGDPATVRWIGNAIQSSSRSITYVAGYGDPSAIPNQIQHAILLTVARMYENRGDGEGEELLSRAVRNLLDPYRMIVFA